MNAADGAAHDGFVAEGLRQYLHGFTVWGETAEHRILTVVDYDGGTLPSVVFLKLSKRLYDRYNGFAAGTAGAEHHLSLLDFWYGLGLLLEAKKVHSALFLNAPSPHGFKSQRIFL